MNVPWCKPIFDKDMKNAAINALQNEKFVLGESVSKFEEKFAEYCGTDFAISTNSGTMALQLTLMAMGLEKGNHVLTTPASFAATANSIIHAQGTPIFSDIDEHTCNLGPALIEKNLSPQTRGILPVHLYGRPADMDEINETAHKYDLFVIEDACQAHGALYKGKRAGSLANAGCFSFYSTKNMTVGGDGGMVTTNDEKIAQKVAKLRDCGRITKYEHDLIGYTARLNTVNAAIGLEQLKKLDEWNQKRRKNANLYVKLLSDVPEIKLPLPESEDVKPVYHLFTIRTGQRDKLKSFLEENGVSCGVNYTIPIHLQPIYKELYGFNEGDFPTAERLSKQVLCLPMFPDLTKEEIKYVVDKIREYFGR